MFRDPQNPLPPTGTHADWLWRPGLILVVSGTDLRRRWGQIKGPDDDVPSLARFDFELELAAVVGLRSDGPVTVARADQNIFGYVLLNDWSARDIQTWETLPLQRHRACRRR